MTAWMLTHRRQSLWALSCSSSLEGRIYFPLWRNKRPPGAPQVLKSWRGVRAATCQHRWVWEANISRSNGSGVENTWLTWLWLIFTQFNQLILFQEGWFLQLNPFIRFHFYFLYFIVSCLLLKMNTNYYLFWSSILYLLVGIVTKNKLFFANDKPIYLHKEQIGLDCAVQQHNGSRKHGPSHSFLSYPQVRHQRAKINVRLCLLFKRETLISPTRPKKEARCSSCPPRQYL